MSGVSELRRKLLAQWKEFLREIDPVAVQGSMEEAPFEEREPERGRAHGAVTWTPVVAPSRADPRPGPPPAPQPSPAVSATPRARPRTLREDLLDRRTLRRAIVLREILDRPLALRADRGRKR